MGIVVAASGVSRRAAECRHHQVYAPLAEQAALSHQCGPGNANTPFRELMQLVRSGRRMDDDC